MGTVVNICTMQHRDIAQVIPDRRDWPMIVLDQPKNESVTRKILELSYELKWRLVDPAYYGDDLPLGTRPKGAIVSHIPSHPLVQTLLKRGCPTVRIGRLPHPEDDRVPAVMEDLVGVGRMAAEHFFERGFRHVGYIGFDPWSDFKAINDGLAARSGELGCECHLFQFKNYFGSEQQSRATRWQQRQRLFAEWIRTIPKPVGLLTFNDEMVGNLCAMCEAAGIVVPEQVAILGHGNDVRACECAQLTISSVAPDLARIGETAVRMLEKLIKGKSVPKTTVMIPPLGVVTRESTDVLATRDPDVARALCFIWDHLASKLSVDDVANAVGCSRRKLERAFRHDIGRGVNQELLRRRLERSCELLRTTDTPIADLAPSLGFGSKDYFQRVFLRTFGISPGRYRREKRS